MKRLLAGLLLAGLAFFVLPHSTSAQSVNDFTITSFSSDQTLTRTDPQGELHIVEKIRVDFSGSNHGIIRAIPNSYKGNSLKLKINHVSSDTGAPAGYDRSSANGNTELKIGDPDRTVTGDQEYTIDYTLQNVISFYNDHAELYWDVNGDQWNQPTESVSVVLHLPADSRLSPQAPKCFAGSYGATAQNCQINITGDTLNASATGLQPRETLTYVVGFENGYFQPASAIEKLRDRIVPVVEFAVPVLLAAGIGFVWWLRRGRDAPGSGTIIPQYEPPAGVTPLKADIIDHFKAGNAALTATIIDLARRGYLKIIENKKDRMIGPDKLSYTLQLMNTDTAGLTQPETALLRALFDTFASNQMVQLEDLKTKLYKTATSVKQTATAELTAGGYFKQDPTRFAKIGGFGFTAGFIALWLFFVIAHSVTVWPLLAGIVVGGLIFILFLRVLPARTAKGVAAHEQLLGLKLYMETAEKDRLQMLESPNAPYAQTSGPARTVELFEKLLPYAIVMGVEKGWADQFKDIYTSPPEWYSGNFSAFSTGYLIGSLNGGFNSAVSSGFSAPSSSGSSGFGGGGFSGGGGGGGGGGGW